MLTNKKLRLLCSTIIATGLLVANVSTAFAIPPLPSSFYGTVKVNGANAAPGAQISAWINGVKFAETTVLIYEGNTVYSLDVPGDDPSTIDVTEGGVAGDRIEFHIDGQVADQASQWAGGTNVENNLAVTQNGSPVIEEGGSASVSAPEDSSQESVVVTLHAADEASPDSLTWSISSQASHGSASASGTGVSKEIEYVPDANYTGSDSFVVQVSNGKGGNDTIVVNVQGKAANEASQASGQSLTVNQDASLANTLPLSTTTEKNETKISSSWMIIGALAIPLLLFIVWLLSGRSGIKRKLEPK